jgi:hypothetical protein
VIPLDANGTGASLAIRRGGLALDVARLDGVLLGCGTRWGASPDVINNVASTPTQAPVKNCPFDSFVCATVRRRAMGQGVDEDGPIPTGGGKSAAVDPRRVEVA